MSVRDSEAESKSPRARRVCPHWRRTVDGIVMASAWHDGRVNMPASPDLPSDLLLFPPAPAQSSWLGLFCKSAFDTCLG